MQLYQVCSECVLETSTSRRQIREGLCTTTYCSTVESRLHCSSYVAEYPKLVLEATEALDTQVTAALPLEFHRLRDSRLAIANNTLRVAKRRDQATSSQAPEPPLLQDGKIKISYLPSWYDRFLEHAHIHFSVA